MTEIEVTLTFTTPPNIGSGAQEVTLADRAIIKAHDGWPYIPATAFKGQLRHAVERVARGMGMEVCETHRKMCRPDRRVCPVCQVFGSPWIPGRLRFVNLELSGPPELVAHREKKPYPRTQSRYGVALNRRRGVAADALLYTTELFEPGVPISFKGTLTGEINLASAAWVVAGLGFLAALGRAKSTGLGWLQAKTVVRIDGQIVDADALRGALEEAHQ
jgi:CRISPR/Cas system CSM-associated protein Csm3 (group 7 of RAMP superfamily)